MPEMPEVETIRRTLADKVVGNKIANVEMLLPRLIKWPSAHEFQALVTNRTIKSLERRGKYLLFYFDSDLVMVVHLRMTGRIYYSSVVEQDDRFIRIIFSFDNGAALFYADSRTLGTLYVMPTNELWRINGLAKLGPEPMSPEFTLEYFQQILAKRKGKIKSLLLNQQIIGGLGNIYVDESLFLAGVRPERNAASLAAEESNRLYQAINKVIEQGINYGGTTFRDYRDGEGKRGENQYHLNVYGRENQPCKTCGTLIAKTEVGGRGTHYCPHCQQ
ncbi:MAG: mutM 2 [Firmicutes bacterium]|nr:mutM 2 [Bacillota bacterium]